MKNQDRFFSGRLRLWKEGWWKEWTPQIVVGVNDFTTGSGGDYTQMGVEGDGNGHFNRYYIAVTKHLFWHGGWIVLEPLGFSFFFCPNKRKTKQKENSPAAFFYLLRWFSPLNKKNSLSLKQLFVFNAPKSTCALR